MWPNPQKREALRTRTRPGATSFKGRGRDRMSSNGRQESIERAQLVGRGGSGPCMQHQHGSHSRNRRGWCRPS
eukprot:scaffold5938_cov122-Isochrysis_galbana.AAC.4